MIQFRLPNFRCQVSDIGQDDKGNATISSTKYWRYCYAESAEKLEDLMKKSLTIHVHKIEPYNFAEDWKKKVESKKREVAAAIAGNKKPAFPPAWGDLKDHLITLFFGKCGYCEAPFAAVSFGDVEHYRPKGKVDEDKKHKGYYWLAYEPTNYLPACQICNEAVKKDHFPIKGTRAYSENDPLGNEDPLLINPYLDAYEEHLEFLPSSHEISPGGPGEPTVGPGSVKGKTDRGKTSISKLGLYRGAIRDLRLIEMSHARKDIKAAYEDNLLRPANPDWDGFKRSLENYLSEDRPFRTAAFYEMRDWLIKMKWQQNDVRAIFFALGFHE
jgi:hypothetical protein